MNGAGQNTVRNSTERSMAFGHGVRNSQVQFLLLMVSIQELESICHLKEEQEQEHERSVKQIHK